MYRTSFINLGDWNVTVKARYPAHILRATPIFLLGVLLSAVVGFFAWFMADEPKKLDRMVTEKTNSLENANLELEDQRSKLLLMNSELKQFVYVASHDLQEPLHMIASFLSKLDQNYSAQLDDKAKRYIHFAVDGANKIRTLIIDLLEYSQVGDSVKSIEHIDTNDVLKDVIQLNTELITAKSATIIFDNLPSLNGFRTSLIQLFGNVVQNALKYSKEGVPPCIEITANESKTWVEFSVSDNGIGIDPEYFDKIFVIFQRVHSTPGVGTTFIIKLLKTINRNVQN